MAPLQRHLKRMLAFSTVSHAGIILAGIGLLSAEGLAGVFLYIAGHGCIKGALFICAGIVLARFGSIDEVRLHGKCGWAGVTPFLFLICALALAGLPPFAVFVGKAAIETAAKEADLHFLLPVMIFASAATGGTVLRAVFGMFLGWGKPDPFSRSAPSSGENELPETDRKQRKTPTVMWISGVVLLTAALGAGIYPGIGHYCRIAATRFVDTGGYRSLVLQGATAERHAAAPPAPIPASGQAASFFEGWEIGLATAFAAVLIAASFLFAFRLPEGVVRLSEKLYQGPMKLARTIHSGHAGDYAAWLTAGVALLLVAAAVLFP
jgi:multicomponent Na+:H+ antiporter subunit D